MFKSSTQLNLMPKENDLLIHHSILQSSPPYPTPKSTFEVSQVVPQEDSSSNVGKISPIVLLIIIILAAFFFILGFLHLLFRYLSKRPPSRSLFIHSNRYNFTIDHQGSTNSSHMLQRQLQQLFRLHDSGLDQSSIDNLPIFHYKDVVMGLVSKSKQQFDCAVCLSEFSNQDKLKLLPICSHAFHINCIDPWLMSNSTCPLCRCTLLLNPSNTTSLSSLTQLTTSVDCSIGMSLSTDSTSTSNSSSSCSATLDKRRVYSIRLGRFKTLANDEGGDDGESSSGKLDGRRCYSMGSYQYVVTHDTCMKFKGVDFDGDYGKKIGRCSVKGDSFSVSKIWLWSKKRKFDDDGGHHHHGGVIGGLDIV